MKILFLSLLCFGCAGSFEEAARPNLRLSTVVPAPSRDQCQALDTAHRNWSASAEASGFVAGATGIATIPVKSDTGRIILASGTVLAGAWAVFSTTEASGAATSWARDCSK